MMFATYKKEGALRLVFLDTLYNLFEFKLSNLMYGNLLFKISLYQYIYCKIRHKILSFLRQLTFTLVPFFARLVSTFTLALKVSRKTKATEDYTLTIGTQ